MALAPGRSTRNTMVTSSTHRALPDHPNDVARRGLVAAIRRDVEREARRRLIWIGLMTGAVVLACAGIALFLAAELRQEQAGIRALRMEIADAARQLARAQGAVGQSAEAAGLTQRLTMLRRQLRRLAPDDLISRPVAARIPLTPLVEAPAAPTSSPGDGGMADAPVVSRLSGAVAARRERPRPAATSGPAPAVLPRDDMRDDRATVTRSPAPWTLERSTGTGRDAVPVGGVSIRTGPPPGNPHAVAPGVAPDPGHRPPTARSGPAAHRVDPGTTAADKLPGTPPPGAGPKPDTLAGQSGPAAGDGNGRAGAAAAATMAVPVARPVVPKTARRLVAAAYRRDADDLARQAAAEAAKARAAETAARQAAAPVEPAAPARPAVDRVGRGQRIIIVFAPGAETLRQRLVEAGFDAVIDTTRPKGRAHFPGKVVSGIRLSARLPAKAATALIAIARAEMSFLRYVYLDTHSKAEGTYIGTLTKVAAEHFYPISDKGFERLSDRTLARDDLHRIIRRFSRHRRAGPL